MAAKNDSSVLFSLRELVDLEAERIRDEEAAVQARLDAEAAARRDAERRAREAEAARLEALESERRVHEARAREEAARLEAMRLAEVERARVAAENQARLATLEREQEHARALAAISEAGGRKRLSLLIAGLAVTLIFAVAGAGFVIHRANRATEAAQAEAARLEREVKALDEQKRALESEKVGKSSEEARIIDEKIRALERAREGLGRPAAPAPTTRRAPTSAPAATTKSRGPAGCQPTCAKGDPICVECNP